MSYFRLNKKQINKQYTFIRRQNNMANFNDYEKHFQKIREGIQEQISLDWHNVKLHTEQLRLSNKYFKQYEYLCILKDLELAEKYLDEAQSMIDGFETCPEEDVPEEMIFTKDEELDKEHEEIPEQETIFDDSKNGVEAFNEFTKKLK